MLVSSSFMAFAQKDSAHLITSWKLTPDYLGTSEAVLDTSVDDIQIYNPVYQLYFSNSALGNFGSPCISNVFSERYDKNEFFFTNVYYPLMYTHDKTIYLNTKRQFTKLLYINGGSTPDKEENLEVIHSQNVNPELNFGLKYNTTLSNGQYRFQSTRRSSFSFFSSYMGDMYAYNLSLNTNNFSTGENGGITHDSLLADINYEGPGDLPTFFGGTVSQSRDKANVTNTFKNIDLFLLNDFNLSNFFLKADTSFADTLQRKTKVGIMLISEFEINKKMFADASPSVGLSQGFYDSAYFNASMTNDSIFYRKIKNTLRFYIDEDSAYTFYVDLSSEFYKYVFYSQDEAYKTQYNLANRTASPFNYNSYESDLKLQSGVVLDPWNLNLKLSGFLYLTGYKQGSYGVYAGFNLFQSKHQAANVRLNAQYSSGQPFFLYNQYYSNYFNWDNDFKPVKKLQLSLKYSHSPKKIESELNYSLLRDQIYFDTNAFPGQYQSGLSVIEFKLIKDFKFWKFHSLNKIALQYVNNETILALPNVNYFNSTYFKQHFHFKLTNGGFTSLLGFDMYYDTKYYGYAYMPAISAFYRQAEKKIGGYPFVDIFLNVELKRARFFFKFEHINSGLLERNYFSILHYPRNERMFKVGISWNFYD
jgi:hypothetical protein